jgi:hypothetical protein
VPAGYQGELPLPLHRQRQRRRVERHRAQGCPGNLSMGPQAMDGNLQVTPGTTLQAGYDFTLRGNTNSLT